MYASTYQVVFTGTLQHGVSRRDGIRGLAQQLGLDFGQIKKLLASSRPVVKRCAIASEGERLVRAFSRAGWRTELLNNGKLVFDGENRFATSGDEAVGEAGVRQLFAVDRRCSIKVPSRWQEIADLNGNAVIQCGCLQENQFLVVLVQTLADLPAASTIETYCGAQLQQCAAKLQGGEILTPATLLDEGSFPGYFGEIRAKIDSVPVQYLVVCLECDDRIFTLFLWCEAQGYPRRKRTFDEIVASFQDEAILLPDASDRAQIERRRMVTSA